MNTAYCVPVNSGARRSSKTVIWYDLYKPLLGECDGNPYGWHVELSLQDSEGHERAIRAFVENESEIARYIQVLYSKLELDLARLSDPSVIGRDVSEDGTVTLRHSEK